MSDTVLFSPDKLEFFVEDKGINVSCRWEDWKARHFFMPAILSFFGRSEIRVEELTYPQFGEFKSYVLETPRRVYITADRLNPAHTSPLTAKKMADPLSEGYAYRAVMEYFRHYAKYLLDNGYIDESTSGEVEKFRDLLRTPRRLQYAPKKGRSGGKKPQNFRLAQKRYKDRGKSWDIDDEDDWLRVMLVTSGDVFAHPLSQRTMVFLYTLLLKHREARENFSRLFRLRTSEFACASPFIFYEPGTTTKLPENVMVQLGDGPEKRFIELWDTRTKCKRVDDVLFRVINTHGGVENVALDPAMFVRWMKLHQKAVGIPETSEYFVSGLNSLVQFVDTGLPTEVGGVEVSVEEEEPTAAVEPEEKEVEKVEEVEVVEKEEVEEVVESGETEVVEAEEKEIEVEPVIASPVVPKEKVEYNFVKLAMRESKVEELVTYVGNRGGEVAFGEIFIHFIDQDRQYYTIWRDYLLNQYAVAVGEKVSLTRNGKIAYDYMRNV